MAIVVPPLPDDPKDDEESTAQLTSTTLASISESLIERYKIAISAITASFPDLATSSRGKWPANLSSLERDDISIDKLKMLMMDEHLPIAWVPRASTIKLVMAAKDAGRRRAVYGQKWRTILDDCEELADKMSSAKTARYVPFVMKSISAIRDGHHESGQALAANTLDTVIGNFISLEAHRQWSGNVGTINPDSLGTRAFFVVSQLWGIHRAFWARKGDPIPGTFNRHGSVHGVSARQYSRLNSVLGVAHLTSFLWVLDCRFAERRIKFSPLVFPAGST